jgi:hypothetical protein
VSTSHWIQEIVHVLGGFRYDILTMRRVPVSVFMVKINASEHLKWATERFFTISDFIEQAETSFGFFSSQKDS